MNNKQQTAIDYYSKEIGRLTSDLITGKITGKQFVMLEIQLLKQAKQMEAQNEKMYYDLGVHYGKYGMPTFSEIKQEGNK